MTLSDALMCSLEFQPVKDAELSWIDARVNVKRRQETEGMEHDAADVDPMDAGTQVLNILKYNF